MDTTTTNTDNTLQSSPNSEIPFPLPLPSLGNGPIRHPSSCASLSLPLLALLDAVLPKPGGAQQPATPSSMPPPLPPQLRPITLSVGSGPGLLEALLLKHYPSRLNTLFGVEVAAGVNRYLPEGNAVTVPGTWAVYSTGPEVVTVYRPKTVMVYGPEETETVDGGETLVYRPREVTTYSPETVTVYSPTAVPVDAADQGDRDQEDEGGGSDEDGGTNNKEVGKVLGVPAEIQGLLFVYPRQPGLIKRYLAEKEKTVRVAVWIGPKCDLDEFSVPLKEWGEEMELEGVSGEEGALVEEGEAVLVFRRREGEVPSNEGVGELEVEVDDI